jgi:molybdate transport system ATP-binding protein
MIELDLTLRRGEFSLEFALATPARALALFGPSGCGKTTILLAIAGLLRPQRGRIAFDDWVLFDDRGRKDVAPARRDLGVVFQEPRLFPHMSVRDNLRYGMPRPRGGARFDATVELLGLSALLKRKPGQLSGGQARRVAIGRALLREPRALLLDEPLANLHRGARTEVLDHLRSLKHELSITTILVSHQHEVATLADTVAMIDDGRLTALQDIDAFRATTGTASGATAMPERYAAR